MASKWPHFRQLKPTTLALLGLDCSRSETKRKKEKFPREFGKIAHQQI
jgi:hypothetical protein